jgi:hypothetical protein
MQSVNRDTDLILQAQQLLKDADSRGLQTLDVLSKKRKTSRFEQTLNICIL